MSDGKKDFFEEIENTVLEFFKDRERKQPPLEEMIKVLRKVKFVRQGDGFWGVVENIGRALTKYHIWVTKDYLSISRGTLRPPLSRVAYYNEPEKNYLFYQELQRNILK